MNTLIKNVDENNWHFLKIQAAKEKRTIGKLFNKIIEEYKQKNQEDVRENWEKIFIRKALLTKNEAEKMHIAMKHFRKEYGFEG